MVRLLILDISIDRAQLRMRIRERANPSSQLNLPLTHRFRSMKNEIEGFNMSALWAWPFSILMFL